MKVVLKLFLLVLFLIPFSLYAQDEEEISVCTQVLDNARLAYDQGRIHEIPDMLESCFRPGGFTNDERVQAYRLLALTHLFEDEPDLADEAMLDLLRTDPEFILQENVEPTDFINLYYSFRTDPIFTLGVKGGLNFLFLNVIEAYSAFDQNDGDQTGEYFPQYGFRGGITFEKNFGRWTVNPELNFSQRSWLLNYPSTDNNQWTVTIHHIENWIDLPVLAQFKIENEDKRDAAYKEGFNPYVYAGGQISYLFSASTGPETQRQRGEDGSFLVGDPVISVSDDLNDIFFSAVAGAGLKYYIPRGFITADVRFTYGITETTHSISYPSDPQLLHSYFKVQNVVRQNVLSFSVGYVKLFYSPKKRTQ